MLLQPVPQQQAAARRLHEPRVDDDAVEPVFGVDGPHVRDALRRGALVQCQPVRSRQHCGVPTFARHDGEMRSVAAVAQHEVDVTERSVLAHALHRLVGILEDFSRPVSVGIAVVLERETGRPVRTGRGVVDKRGKRPRLACRRRGEVRRQIAGGGGRAGKHAEQRRSAAREPALDACAHRVEIGARRLQHEHATQAHRRRREPRAAHAEREVAGTDRSLFEQVGLLDEHLDWKARGQHLDQRGVLGCIVAPGGNADQVVGEERQVVRGERVLVVALEERIVVGLDVRAIRFELGDRDRLDDLGEAWQPLAVRRRRRRAIREHEIPARNRRFVGIGVERLRAEHRKRPFDATAPGGRQLVLRRAPRNELRHDGKIEDIGVPAADRRRERRGLLARCRARERRAPDVGKLPDQRVDQRAELAPLLRLRVTPRLLDDALGQRRITVDELAIHRQRIARLRQHARDGLVGAGAHALGRASPQLGQRPLLARGHQRAQLSLEPQHVLAQPFAVDAARRELGEKRRDHARQRMDVAAAGRRLRQHEREVVAQPRQVAVPGEERRPQGADIDRRETIARAIAGHVEDALILEFRRHVHGMSLVRVADGLRLPGPACLRPARS